MSSIRSFSVVCTGLSVVIVFVALVHAETASPDDQSWTSTSQNITANANSFRTKETHTTSGDRTWDNAITEVVGPDGRYQLYVRVETETIHENPNLTRSITRTYNPSQGGGERLRQVTETKTRTSDNVVRTEQTISSSEYDGRPRVLERETTETTKGPDSQKKQTTVYLPSISGDLSPTMKVNEQQTRKPNGDTEIKSETLLVDTNGRWQLYEVREQKVTGGDRNRTTSDRLYRRDFEGNISPVSEVITSEMNAKGQSTSTREVYSVDVPGATRDNSLHPVESSTTVRTTERDRVITEQQVLRHNAEEKGVDTLVATKDTVTRSSSGTEETIVVDARYPDGSPSVVSVETRKSDRTDVK